MKQPSYNTLNPGIQIFIVEFLQYHLPYSIYILGELKCSVVYKMRNNPLMYNRCLKTGHPQKYCRTEAHTCRNCEETRHYMLQNALHPPSSLYTALKTIELEIETVKYIRENQIADIQQSQKITPRRARQIINNNSEFDGAQRPRFVTHFDCKKEESHKRQLTPWVIEKSLTNFIVQKPKYIRSKDINALTI